MSRLIQIFNELCVWREGIMKNQYFGDIGDYGKYGLLKFLGERDVKIAVNWYLTKNDKNKPGDGKFTE